MADLRCDCHDMLVADCDRLKGAEQRERSEVTAAKARERSLVTRHRAITADYPGVCGGCGDLYPAGAAISKRRSDSVWRAACCLDDNGAPVR